MILICVKWKIKPEYADRWPELSREFTEATRAEPGNRFFDWSSAALEFIIELAPLLLRGIAKLFMRVVKGILD